MGFSISSGVFFKRQKLFFSQLDHASTSAQSTEATSGAGGTFLQHDNQKKKRKSDASLTLGIDKNEQSAQEKMVKGDTRGVGGDGI